MIPTWRGPPTHFPQWQGMPPQGAPPFYWQNQGPMMGQQIPPNFNMTPQNNSNKEVSNASNVEDQKLMSLQMQAQQWQQQKQMQEWLNQNNPQMAPPNLSVALTPEQLKTKNDKTLELEAIKKEEEEFDKQYREWEKQFDQWKEQNKNHPNKEQFKQYEEQWSQWKTQMNGKRAEILGKKDAVEIVLAQLNAQTTAPGSNTNPNPYNQPPSSANALSNNAGNTNQFMYGAGGGPMPPQGMGMNNFAGSVPGGASMMQSGQQANYPMTGLNNVQQQPSQMVPQQPSGYNNNNNNMMIPRPNDNSYASNYNYPDKGNFTSYQPTPNPLGGRGPGLGGDGYNPGSFKPQSYESTNEDNRYEDEGYDNDGPPNPSYNAAGMGNYGNTYGAAGAGAGVPGPAFNYNNSGSNTGPMRPRLPTPSASFSPLNNNHNKAFNSSCVPFEDEAAGSNDHTATFNMAAKKGLPPPFQPTGQFTYGASLSSLSASTGERRKASRWSQPALQNDSFSNNTNNNNGNDNNANSGPVREDHQYDSEDNNGGYQEERMNRDNALAFQASSLGNFAAPPLMAGPHLTGQIQDGDGLGGEGMMGGPSSHYPQSRPPFNPAAAAMMMMMRLRGAAGPPRFSLSPGGMGPRGGGPFANRPPFPVGGPPFGRRPFPYPRTGGPDPTRSRSRSPTTSRSSSGKNQNFGFGNENFRGGSGGGGMMSMPPYKVGGTRPPFRPRQPRFNSNNSFQGGRPPRLMQQKYGHQGPGHGIGDHKSNNSDSDQYLFYPDNPSIDDELNQPESFNESPDVVRCIAIDEILVEPLPKTFIVLRGLPGAGKSYAAKRIKDIAVAKNVTTPKILSLDDYFITEVEKVKGGGQSKTTVMEYKFEAELLHSYVESLGKSVRKQLETGNFELLIMDAFNNLVSQFEPLAYHALHCGYRVYVGEVSTSPELAFERNIHDRTLEEISTLSKCWQPCPLHFTRLNVESLFVEKEKKSPSRNIEKSDEKWEEKREKDIENNDEIISAGGISRWELEQSEENLSKLDGMSVKRKANLHNKLTMEDYLQLPDDYDTRAVQPGDGKKRVRWADVEERKDQQKKRAMGFVMGQTDWKKMVDDQHAEKALNRTKYI